MSDRFLLLKSATEPGRDERIWAIGVIAGGLIIQTGIAGKSMQRREVPSSKWTNGTAEGEAHKRVRERIEGDNYVVVGTCGFDNDGNLLDLVEDADADLPLPDGSTLVRKKAATNGVLYWELDAPDWDALRRAMDAASEGIDVRWVNKNGLPSGVPSIGRWILDLKHKGTGPVKSAGLVPANTPVAVALWLFALREKGLNHEVYVTLADKAGKGISSMRRHENVLNDFGSSFAQVKETAENLGIIPVEVLLHEVKGSDDYF